MSPGVSSKKSRFFNTYSITPHAAFSSGSGEAEKGKKTDSRIDGRFFSVSHDDPELWLAHPHCSVRSESRCIIGAPRPPIAQRATDTKPSVVLLSPRSHRPQVEETSHPRSRSALSSCFPLFLGSREAEKGKKGPNERFLLPY